MNTRMVAGESLSLDVPKCQLKPLNLRDYQVAFTAAEQQRPRETFPPGSVTTAAQPHRYLAELRRRQDRHHHQR